jgi:hypothetical protein
VYTHSTVGISCCTYDDNNFVVCLVNYRCKLIKLCAFLYVMIYV